MTLDEVRRNSRLGNPELETEIRTMQEMCSEMRLRGGIALVQAERCLRAAHFFCSNAIRQGIEVMASCLLWHREVET